MSARGTPRHTQEDTMRDSLAQSDSLTILNDLTRRAIDATATAVRQNQFTRRDHGDYTYCSLALVGRRH